MTGPGKRYRSQLATTPPDPPTPLIAPTGSPGLNSVIDVINNTAAPFQSAPPAEQGAAGWISQGLGGVLALFGAPQDIIDTAFASLTAPIAALFPSLPACTLGAMHIGIPHAHLHPPSFIPPAPPIPLPSIGCVLGSGSITVWVGGLPAARAGDIGISVTCGSLAPPFEIFTGSSNVFLGGARAARTLDITQHCNPMSLGLFDKAMGAAGVIAGAAGAIATGNAYAAAQAAADAAVLALKLLCGKDPGIPPGAGVGALVGPPVPNVLIGGFPCPPIGDMAVGGLMKALAKGMRALRNAYNARRGNAHSADGSHPIYLPTGENFDSFIDFVSGGLFEWRRHVTSARAGEDGPHGFGWRHFLQRSLRVRLHRATYIDWDGERFEFPRFPRGEDTVCSNGYVLHRIERGRYTLRYRGQPTMEFAGQEFDGDLPLVRMTGKGRELGLEHDSFGRLCAAVEHPEGSVYDARRWELRRDGYGRIIEVVEVGAGGVGRTTSGPPVVCAAFAYDKCGNMHKVGDALGGVSAYEYDAFHRVTRQTDQRGYSYSFKYDVWGRCVSASGMDGLWWCKVEYFPEDRYTRYTEGDNATHEFHYDADGFVTKIVDPYGGVKIRERDLEGKLVREIDSGGRELRWLYDADGCHHMRVDHFGYVYPPELDMPWRPNPRRRELPTTALARQYGKLIELSPLAYLGVDNAVLRSVPPMVVQMVQACFRFRPAGAVGAYKPRVEHDVLGRKILETDNAGRTQTWRYDATGNEIARTDHDGRVHQQRTTSWNLVGERHDPLGNAMRYHYSSLEQVVGITDPLGNSSRYDYDLKKRLVRVHRHGCVREQYVYDEGDHFIEKRDGRGELLFRNEIHDNHDVAMRHLASGGFHRYDYDERGLVTEASTQDHEIQLGYDVLGRRRADLRDGEGVHHRVDRGGQRLVSRVLDSFEFSEEAELRGIIRFTDSTGGSWTLRHGVDGVVCRECANGTVELSQYDGDGKLTAQIAYRSRADGSMSGWAIRYTYSAEGDLLRIDDSARGSTVYEVDLAHRLVGEVGPDRQREVIEFDAAGNVLSKSGLRRVEVDANRLVASEDEVFEYNERNHLAVRRGRDGSVVRYTYNSFDMLVAVERLAADGEIDLRWSAGYDGLGRRLWCIANEHRREFYWDGDRLAAERFPDRMLRVYQYAGQDALVPVGFTEHDEGDANPAGGRGFQVFSNTVGMPLCIEGQAGEVVWWAERVDPYGTIELCDGAQVEYNLRWPGHYYDADIELHYNRYRYYDPRLGRYLQSDPIGYEGSERNLYAYCENPLVSIDLLGLAHKNTIGSESGDQNIEGTDSTKNSAEEGGPLPPKGTAAGDAARYDRYRQNGGNLSFDKWYPRSRGGRSGGPGHQEIQNRLAERPGFETERRFGDRYADAYTEGEVHQIGGFNERGDPIKRERDAINDIINSPGYNGEAIYFWDKNNPGTPPIKNPHLLPNWGG